MGPPGNPIGAGVRIEAGAILGCEGLYAKKIAGERIHIPHFGGVDVGDDAFIHAGAIVVRSAVRGEATRVGRRAHEAIGNRDPLVDGVDAQQRVERLE